MQNDYPTLTQRELDCVAVSMDDDIREQIHSDIAPCEPGEFLTAYLSADRDFPIHQFGLGHDA